MDGIPVSPRPTTSALIEQVASKKKRKEPRKKKTRYAGFAQPSLSLSESGMKP